MDKVGKMLENFRTNCCDAKWYRKSRANYRCTKCEEDITLHLVYLRKLLEDEYIDEINDDKRDKSS